MKKVIVLLCLILILLVGINLHKAATATTECWWGVIYPNLSYVAFEDTENTKISASDTKYIYLNDNKIKYKFAIVEWFNNVFNFGQ